MTFVRVRPGMRWSRLTWLGALTLAACGGIAERDDRPTPTPSVPTTPAPSDSGSGGAAGAGGFGSTGGTSGAGGLTGPGGAPPYVPKAIYAGDETSFAILSDGRVASWGRNDSGELGHPGSGLFSVDDLGFVPTLVSADDHTCFLDSAGVIRCAGSNGYFELGDGTNKSRSDPTRVTVISDPATIVAAGPNQTCAYTTPPMLRCWGQGFADAQLRMLSEGVEYVDLAVGGNHECALRADKTIACWGEYTMWDHGTNYGYALAIDITSIGRVAQLVAGFSYSCARTAEGRVWCWGDNENSQLGTPAVMGSCPSDCEATPHLIDLPPGAEAAKIVAKSNSTVALTSDGRLFGWGGVPHDGVCGRGLICTSAPRQLADFDDITDVSLGSGHLCVLRRDNSVWCWGDNDYHQVANTGGSFIAAPVRVMPR